MKKTTFDIHTLVRPNVAKLKPYSSARDEFQSTGTEMIFLDANENPFPTDVNRYPDPQQRNLKHELAALRSVAPGQILLGNGSDEILDLLFRAFCEPEQDNVITLPPTYGMYSVLAGINNVENREVLLTTGFEPDTAAVIQRADAYSKIVFLCSPNNPTGNSFSEKAVVDLLEEFNGLVVIDEAYIDFSDRPGWLRQLHRYPNLIITHTLSKAYGLAGIRLGICYASEEIIQILNKIKPPYNVNELTQQRALQRLLDRDQVYSQIADIITSRTLLAKALSELPFVKTIYRSDANFILIEVDDANRRYTQLLEKGIVARNRTSQPLCENTLRLTVGTRYENIQLVKALQGLR